MITSFVFKRFLHATTIIYYVVGMFYFYTLSDFYYSKYDNQIYFAFTKLFDFLLIICIVNPMREFNSAWATIGLFFVVRFVWQLFAIKDYATASRPSIIFSLFIIDVICLVIIFILQIKQKPK